MNIIYLRDQNLASQLPALTFGELRTMLPEISDEERIPRPESLENDLRNRFLEVDEDDFSIRIYSSGVCLYLEESGKSAYAVSKCATLEFPSVSAGYAAKVPADDMRWLLPLVITGQERASHNLDSNEGYNILHFEAGIPDRLMPYTPNFVFEVSPEEDEENYRRKLRNLYDKLARVMRCMTKRQRQIFLLRYQDNTKPEKIAAQLGICRSVVFDTLQRANQKVDRYLSR